MLKKNHSLISFKIHHKIVFTIRSQFIDVQFTNRLALNEKILLIKMTEKKIFYN